MQWLSLRVVRLKHHYLPVASLSCPASVVSLAAQQITKLSQSQFSAQQPAVWQVLHNSGVVGDALNSSYMLRQEHLFAELEGAMSRHYVVRHARVRW
jgi:hypothetical protein